MISKKLSYKAPILFFISLYIAIVFSILTSAEVEINEIMYNPLTCSDSECEWVELYNSDKEDYSLEECYFEDEKLSGEIFSEGYFLIVRNLEAFLENFEIEGYEKYLENIVQNESVEILEINDSIVSNETNVSNEFVINSENVSYEQNSVYLDVTSVTNTNKTFLSFDNLTILEIPISLKNSGEEISLTGSNYCNDIFDYMNYINFANGNGKSLEKNFEGGWEESETINGTAGKINSIYGISYDFSSLIISEFLANPNGDDDALMPSGEWIEIYNPNNFEINLDGLFFEDAAKNKLYITSTNVIDSNTIIKGNSYFVVYRNGKNTFSLNNNGFENLSLYSKESELLNFVSYDDSTESLSWSKIENEWLQTKTSPAKLNEKDNSCDWNLEIGGLQEKIMLSDEMDFTLKLEKEYGFKTEITVKGEIKDYNGEIIKEYKPWTDKVVNSQASKTYSPNLAKGIYELHFWIEENNCSDFDESDDEVYSLLAINPNYQKNESSLEIEKLYFGTDLIVKQGDIFQAKINIYKGGTNKYAISSYVLVDEKIVSEKTKFNVYENYQDYTLTIPIQLDNDCERGEKVDAILVLEGLDERKEFDFEISGVNEKLCPEKEKEIEEERKNETPTTLETKNYELNFSESNASTFFSDNYLTGATFAYSNKENSNLWGETIYRSSSKKSSLLILFIFLVACFALIVGFLKIKNE